MPIKRLLAQSTLTQEQQQVLESAFVLALRKLGLVDRNDPICEIVARKVMEMAARGNNTAVAIAEATFKQLAPNRP